MESVLMYSMVQCAIYFFLQQNVVPFGYPKQYYSLVEGEHQIESDSVKRAFEAIEKKTNISRDDDFIERSRTILMNRKLTLDHYAAFFIFKFEDFPASCDIMWCFKWFIASLNNRIHSSPYPVKYKISEKAINMETIDDLKQHIKSIDLEKQISESDEDLANLYLYRYADRHISSIANIITQVRVTQGMNNTSFHSLLNVYKYLDLCFYD